MRQSAIRVGLAAFAAGLVLDLAAGSALAASAEKGKEAFLKHGCFQCHGTVGQGSVATSGGRVLYDTKLPIEAFVGYVRSTNQSMPPYSEKILSDSDLADIYAYLTSLPKTADFKTIPLLNQ
ncbi:MAG TPA: cytochrome c [Xanthobacteraceae bacterium]|nr:cytochrome c [Xanthobacteraceae bacterium]